MSTAEKKATILVVDDDPLLLSLLVDTLTAVGHRVIAASGGVEAIERLNEHSFDLVITDVRMPDIDGITLFRKIRRHYPHLPVLFITGGETDEVVGTATPDGLLAKPFRISRIEELIEDTLRNAAKGHSDRMRNVLILAEEEQLRDDLTRALENSTYMPFLVPNGDRALKELESGRFYALIANVKKADPDRRHWLERLRSVYPDLPLILTGDAAQSESSRESDLLRAQGYLHRQFTIDDVLNLLDHISPEVSGNN